MKGSGCRERSRRGIELLPAQSGLGHVNCKIRRNNDGPTFWCLEASIAKRIYLGVDISCANEYILDWSSGKYLLQLKDHIHCKVEVVPLIAFGLEGVLGQVLGLPLS